MNDSFDVAVVGCGPTGAVCAGFLTRAGARTLVVERNRAVYDKPRAFALDHEIMRVFQDLGVADAVAPHTAPFTPSEYYGADGQLIKRLGALPPPWPLGWPPSLVFRQPEVEAILRRHVEQRATVVFSELQGLEQDAHEVRFRTNGQSFRAKYLVGCDGATSTVRRALGIEYEDLGFDQDWLVVDVLANARGLAKLPQVSIQYCEPARPSTYLVGVGNHRRWELMLNAGEEPDVWRLLSRWLTPQDGELWRHASYRFHALAARRWRSGRVFLAGDAAHQQPPFTGQGMCQGIRDAANLAWKLELVLANKANDKLLDTYEVERGAHVRRLTETIKGIGRIIGERDPAAARERDRRLLAEAGGRIVTVPRQDLIPPLEDGFLSSEKHPAVGTLFPAHDSTGFVTVRKDPSNAWWFEKHGAIAAIVRPDHYVYGAAASEAALDRQLAAMAKGLS